MATIALWAPVHLVIVGWGRPWHFAVYAAAITAVGLWELFALQRRRGLSPSRLWVVVNGVAYIAAMAAAPRWALAVAALFAAGTLGLVVLRPDVDGALADAGATTMGFIYVPLSLGFLVWIKTWGAGATALLTFFLTLWASDVAAFAVGKTLGRRRLAPALSPGKTVAGTAAGLGAATLTAAALTGFVFRGLAISAALGALVGFVIGVFGLVGDLAESAFKRDAGVKDSGAILPGHGGVLDRFDSAFLAAPAYCGILLLLGKAG